MMTCMCADPKCIVEGCRRALERNQKKLDELSTIRRVLDPPKMNPSDKTK